MDIKNLFGKKKENPKDVKTKIITETAKSEIIPAGESNEETKPVAQDLSANSIFVKNAKEVVGAKHVVQNKPLKKGSKTVKEKEKKSALVKKIAAYEKPVKLMTIKYVLALLMFIVLAVDGYLIVRGSLKSAQFSVNRISISGNQQVLYEKSVLLAEELVKTIDLEQRQELRTKLLEIISLFERNHNALIRGDKETQLPPSNSKEVNDIYYVLPVYLDKHVENYAKAIRFLAETPDSELSEDNKGLLYIREIKNSQRIVNALNVLIKQFVIENQKEVQSIKTNANLIVVNTIAVILLAGVFIFHPMVREVRKSFKGLEELTETLEKRVEERTEVLTNLNKDLNNELNLQKKNVEESRSKMEELQRLGEESRKNESLFRSLAEGMADLIAIIDSENRFVYANSAYKKFSNEGNSILGNDYFFNVFQEDKEKIKNTFSKVINTGMPLRTEYRVVLGDGKLINFELMASNINDASEKPGKLVVVSREQELSDNNSNTSEIIPSEQNVPQNLTVNNQVPSRSIFQGQGTSKSIFQTRNIVKPENQDLPKEPPSNAPGMFFDEP